MKAEGLAYFEECYEKIKLIGAKGEALELQVPDTETGGFFIVTLVPSQFRYHCTCAQARKAVYCSHVPAATYWLLLRQYNEPAKAVEKQIKLKFNNNIHKIFVAPVSSTVNKETVEEPLMNVIKAAPQMLEHQVRMLTQYRTNDYYIRASLKLISETTEPLSWLFSVKDNTKTYTPLISFNKVDEYYYLCTCKVNRKMCSHVSAAFIATLDKDAFFFSKHINRSGQMAAMLQPYGIRAESPEAQGFSFILNNHHQLELVPPAHFWKAGDTEKINFLKDSIMPARVKKEITVKDFVDFELGFLFNFKSKHFKNGFELEGIKFTQKTLKEVPSKFSFQQNQNNDTLKTIPAEISELITSLSDTELKKHLPQQNYYYGNHLNDLNSTAQKILDERYNYLVAQLWPWLVTQRAYTLNEQRFSASDIVPVSLSSTLLHPRFVVETNEAHIDLKLIWQKDALDILPEDYIVRNEMFIETNGVLFLPAPRDRALLKQFAHGYIRMATSDKAILAKEIIPALQKKYEVELPPAMQMERLAIIPTPQILVKEYFEKFLMLQPRFDYDGVVVDYEPAPEDIVQLSTEGHIQFVTRDETLEKEFSESLRVLHPAFEKQLVNDFYYLPFSEVMKGNWFVKIIAELQEKNVPVVGIQALEKFKYNTNKPKWEMKAGSGIDWFDLQIEISFGDQLISLPEVRKAVLGGQNVVVLGDGTLGMLPEEWLKKYGLLLKLGEVQKNGSMLISKLHFTLIDELYGMIDDEQVLKEIEEKKQKLHGIENVATTKPSKQIKAIHRPYQLSGFNWLQVLDEIGWGGCLADDMGLGKTLQAITFLQYIKEKYKKSTSLVVCPTSLIYNWETELQKFAPKLKYHIHYGTTRDFNDEHFEKFDIIITSYGMVRSDIEHLRTFRFEYVVLDESQAIKNPEAQVTKAVQLLQCRNKLILSGTPVQNNTYDLYAQFNFINPGLLGNRDFFKKEFANPIDKDNNADTSNRLRRLVYPFLLRRTKAQVATDLPDKTESILWCDMPKDQRAVYDHYKDYYRNLLAEKIAEQGMAKSGMYVLEGLLRLRQICDSPELLKRKEVKAKSSIKIQELLREIKENTGEHKMLIFSQFTEMLALIKKGLEAEGYTYCYLDGSTPAHKRQEAVNEFQNNQSVKIFLISLKAGGVGLNLTAADYVYIVDPWWNPAVEQQAIDRTHRIGQQQKIFAYKMICKDTVEEKILQLQSKKKQLANDLITEDAGFIKKMKAEDVEFLFS